MRSYYRRKKEVLEYYSRLSKKYETIRFPCVKSKLISMFQIKWFLSGFKRKCNTLLEIGSGTGRLTSHLVNVSNFLIATDASLSMLKVLKENMTSHKTQQTELILCDVSHLPLKDNSIDGVVAARLFWHLPDFAKAITESVRVLRNRGLLLFDFPNKTGLFAISYRFSKINDVLTLFATSSQLENLGKQINVNVKLAGNTSLFLFLPEKLFNIKRLYNALVFLSKLIERLGAFWPFKIFMNYWLVEYQRF